VICRLARELAAGLIVLGALEQETALSYLLGSIARNIARSAPCSVMLLPNPRHKPVAFRRPQVLIDHPQRSRQMMEFVLRLANREGAHDLHAVSEYDQTGLNLGASDSGAEDAETYRRSLQSQEEITLANFIAAFDTRAIPLKSAALCGKRGYEAVEYARAHRRDLLVMRAPAGRLTLWGRFFPADAEVALRHLPCALLLFRAQRSGRTATFSKKPDA
jgi:nucleotide-binding universal stress UspA family protein